MKSLRYLQSQQVSRFLVKSLMMILIRQKRRLQQHPPRDLLEKLVEPQPILLKLGNGQAVEHGNQLSRTSSVIATKELSSQKIMGVIRHVSRWLNVGIYHAPSGSSGGSVSSSGNIGQAY